MEIKIKKYESIYIVNVIGDMDLYTSFKLKNVIDKMFQKKIKNYIINFEKVDYIDSRGIGILIHIYSTIKKANLLLRITNIHGSVKKVIELTKLTQYFPIVDTVEEAIKEIKVQLEKDE